MRQNTRDLITHSKLFYLVIYIGKPFASVYFIQHNSYTTALLSWIASRACPLLQLPCCDFMMDTSLDEDDLAAALLLMQQASRNNDRRSFEDLFGNENEDPEEFEPLGGKKRAKAALPWVLLQRYEGNDANVRAEEELLSVAGPAWQEASKRTSQRAGVQRVLPKFTSDKTLLSGDTIIEYKCPLAEVIIVPVTFG